MGGFNDPRLILEAKVQKLQKLVRLNKTIRNYSDLGGGSRPFCPPLVKHA